MRGIEYGTHGYLYEQLLNFHRLFELNIIGCLKKDYGPHNVTESGHCERTFLWVKGHVI